MKRNIYKNFKTQVIESSVGNEPIYYMGYMWLQLTEKQAEEIRTILESKDFTSIKEYNGRKILQQNVVGFGLYY